jgi:[acyl-carrier-protein] S-malonyltransferase
VVITGTKKGVRMACKAFMAEGAKKAVPLAIGGSFHSPFMNEAKKELGAIINEVEFKTPRIPIYQCVDAKPHINPDELRANLIEHITSSVLWTDMVNNMDADGVTDYYEVGTDDTLQKIVARMKPHAKVGSLLHIPSYDGKIMDYSVVKE